MSQESRYSKIFVKIWHSKDFRTLSEEAKMLFVYLLTSPHRNMGGFYYLPLPYLCFDTGLGEERVSKAIEELSGKDMALYDYDAQVVFIKRWFSYNPIENENQAKGLNKQLAEIPKNNLIEPFVDCVKEHCKYTETILKGISIPFLNPFERVSEPYTKPGTGTGTGTGTGKEIRPNSSSPDPSPDQPDQSIDHNKEPDNQEDGQKEPDIKFTSESRPFKAAAYLRKKILENNTRAKVPNEDPADKLMQKWATDLDRLNRIGPPGKDPKENHGYNWEEIAEIINYCQDDEFWQGNILSASKLREQAVKLENQMKRQHPRGDPKNKKGVGLNGESGERFKKDRFAGLARDAGTGRLLDEENG